MVTESSVPARENSVAAARAVRHLQVEAVQWITDEIYRRHQSVLRLRGARGRYHTEQDLKYHIEFLSGALAIRNPVFFTNYVCWLANVLETRGVPVPMLYESLELLEDFYGRRLDASLRPPLARYLEAGRLALSDGRQAREVSYANVHRPADLVSVDGLKESLMTGDATSAWSIVRACWEETGDYVAIATRLFQPALYDIGTAWQRNEITVAQEHLATAISQTLLTQLYLVAGSQAEPSGRKALFAGVEDNRHVLGVRMVSDAFALAGWSVEYLGADTPTEALLQHVDATTPEVLGVSASMVQQLPALQRLVEVVRAELGERRPIILVGGLSTNQFDDVWRWLGADLWSPDAAHAVKELG